MKKSTKLLVGVSALSAVTAVATFGVGEVLHYAVLTCKGNKQVQKLMAKKPSLTESYKPDELQQKASEWFGGTEHSLVYSANCLGDQTKAECFINDESSNKWAIICHGYGADPGSMARYAMAYYEKGFNCVLPYMRGNENSVSENYSMGWLDRYDVVGWIYYVLHKNPKAKIVLHGESMGAATVMMTVGEQLPENVVCAVEDCGYTSVWDEFSYQINEMFKLPVVPFLYGAQAMTTLQSGLDYKKASAVEQLKKSTTPMLFIHGESDDFVPFEMVFKNYDAFDGEKDILTVPGAQHARSVNTSPEVYWNKVWGFVGKYIELDKEEQNA